MSLATLFWDEGTLKILDQRRLPNECVYIACRTSEELIEAIQNLAVRGAPAIGVAAAYGMVLIARECEAVSDFETAFLQAAEKLKNARPTAINLSWAVEEMMEVYRHTPQMRLYDALLLKAKEIESQDKELCEAISCHGARIFQGRTHLKLLTHCNAGALATAGRGTAVGVIAKLHEKGQVECVYVDETRPLLQGARLTAWELQENHIPCRLITDNMAASVMRNIGIDGVIVGADRIAKNGDVANKIGTYGLAVLCQYHHIPFYVAAPFSTFDKTLDTGRDIPIEERNGEEVRSYRGITMAPAKIEVYNPAFDVTPAELITGIITEKGVLTAPFSEI